MLLFVSCGNNTEPSVEVVTNQLTPYYEDKNYIYYRPLVDYNEYSETQYQTGCLNLPLVYGIQPTITIIDDALNMYTVTMNDPQSNEPLFCELGIYDFINDIYSPFITLDSGHSIGFIAAVSENYIVWEESLDGYSWGITQLHLFDKENQQDIVFYSHTINPETGKVYQSNFNSAVIIGDKVFFDDMTGIVEGQYQMNIFCYDIPSRTIEVISPMAKRPVRYENGIAYLKKMANSEYSVLYYYGNSQERALDILSEDALNDRNIADIAISGSTVFLSKNNYENDDTTADKTHVLSTDLYVGKDSAPIISGKTSNYTYGARTNGEIVIWEVTNPEKPVFYDTDKEIFVRLSDADERYYASFITSDAVIFLAYSEQYNEVSPLDYILIEY
jgi:hypothetical protein